MISNGNSFEHSNGNSMDLGTNSYSATAQTGNLGGAYQRLLAVHGHRW